MTDRNLEIALSDAKGIAKDLSEIFCCQTDALIDELKILNNKLLHLNDTLSGIAVSTRNMEPDSK